MRLPGIKLVCHVLLVETDSGLVLVDTGFGLGDIADPGHRIGNYRWFARPALQPAQTALRRLENLGYHRADVRHIALTHLDVDHIGGVSDFPGATVHVTQAEVQAMRAPRTLIERARYRHSRWILDAPLVEHDPTGEPWHGFPQAHELTEISSGIALIPLPGHSRGHTAVAVDAGHRWIIHAGDAAYLHSTLDRTGSTPLALALQERMTTHNLDQLRESRRRLAELHQRHDPTLTIVTSHDPELLAHARDTA